MDDVVDFDGMRQFAEETVALYEHVTFRPRESIHAEDLLVALDTVNTLTRRVEELEGENAQIVERVLAIVEAGCDRCDKSQFASGLIPWVRDQLAALPTTPHPMEQTMDDLREKVARALAYHDGVPNGRWYGTAEVVFEAIRESGYRIVPVEPTEEFVRSLIRHLNMDPNDEGVRIAVRAALQGFLTAYGQKGE